MAVPWVWRTAKQGPRPYLAPSRMALSNGVKGMLSVACFPSGTFLLRAGIFLSFLGVPGMQTWELDVAVGDGEDAAVPHTWLSPTSCFGARCPLQQREASPLSLGPSWRGRMWQEVHGAVPTSSVSLQVGNRPPPSCVEQDTDIFAFQASLRALVVEMHFSITQRTGPF